MYTLHTEPVYEKPEGAKLTRTVPLEALKTAVGDPTARGSLILFTPVVMAVVLVEFPMLSLRDPALAARTIA